MNERRTEIPSEALVAFRTALGVIRNAPGKEKELVTFADDTVSGFKRTYSSACPFRPENMLKSALTDFISEIVPEGKNRTTLEAGFAQNPDQIKHKSHHDEVTSEWQTLQKGVVIGIHAIRDQRGESARSWYLRNTSRDKKPL